MTKMALLQIGYQHYAVPIDELSKALLLFEGMRKVDYRYEGGYIYWYEDKAKAESNISVSIVSADSILATEPEKKPAVPAVAPKVKTKDERVLAAPSAEPITIGPLPPLREFVNEHRDEAEAA